MTEYRFRHVIDGQQRSCDCCGRNAELGMVIAYGIETWACDRCRGMADDYEVIESGGCAPPVIASRD